MTRVENALYRTAQDLVKEHPETSEISDHVASFLNGAIAIDFGARILYCNELHSIEIVAKFTPKHEITEKIKKLISRMEQKRNAISTTA